MSGILDDLRHSWNKPNNEVARVIIINAAVFVLVNLLFLVQASWLSLFLYVPSDLGALIRQPWSLITSGFTHQ